MGLKSVITPSEPTTVYTPIKTETVDKNPYMDIVATKYTGTNWFLKWLNKRAFNKKLKEIQSRSPSFGELWYFAEFIKTAERVYFVDNRQKSWFYSSRSYGPGENGFVLDVEMLPIRIVVKLYSDDSRVVMNISRTNGSNMTTEHTFINNSWTDDRKEYDEILIDTVIGAINHMIILLLKDCWSRAGLYNNLDIKVKK